MNIGNKITLINTLLRVTATVAWQYLYVIDELSQKVTVSTAELLPFFSVLAAFAFINSFNEELKFDKLWYAFKNAFSLLKYTRALQPQTKIHSLQ